MTTLDIPVGRDPEAGGEGESGERDVEQEDRAALPNTNRPNPDDLDLGEIFELLKNERRRQIIEFLNTREDRTSTLDAVAEYIASIENDVPIEQLSSQQRKRVYIALYQCHLPKMDHFGVVDFEKDRGTITLVNTTLLDPYLDDRTTEDTGTTDRTELAIAVSVTAIVAAGVTGYGILGVVPTVFWTAISVVALLWIAAS